MRQKPLFSTLNSAIVATLLLAACTGKEPQDTSATAAGTAPDAKVVAAAEKIPPVEQLYNKAAAALDEGRYFEAAKQFEDVERQYPYSQWAVKAQLMNGFAYYRGLKYDEATIALDRFIELHPGDENIAYAYYLRALCYYEQISDVRRDQRMTSLALENLRLVAERFADSKYAKDASLKIDLTMDHLAGKEMEIGRYYLERKQYQAAVNRFNKVVTEFQTTTHVPEALHRLTEAYLAMGIPAEAKRTAAILGHNYPQSSWYRDSFRLFGGEIPAPAAAEETGLYDKTIGRIF